MPILITFTGLGYTLDPQCRDASLLLSDKKLPPLNPANGDCIFLAPLLWHSWILPFVRRPVSVLPFFSEPFAGLFHKKKALIALLPSANERWSKVPTASLSDSARASLGKSHIRFLQKMYAANPARLAKTSSQLSYWELYEAFLFLLRELLYHRAHGSFTDFFLSFLITIHSAHYYIWKLCRRK